MHGALFHDEWIAIHHPSQAVLHLKSSVMHFLLFFFTHSLLPVSFKLQKEGKKEWIPNKRGWNTRYSGRPSFNGLVTFTPVWTRPCMQPCVESTGCIFFPKQDLTSYYAALFFPFSETCHLHSKTSVPVWVFSTSLTFCVCVYVRREWERRREIQTGQGVEREQERESEQL